jgi:MFS family permease
MSNIKGPGGIQDPGGTNPADGSKFSAGVNVPPGQDLAGPGTNEKILFWASFLTLIAAGIGFSIRAAILGEWAKQFGFTYGELGGITGGGLVGFGVTIIFFSFLADKVGYGPLMVVAFLLHFSSAVVTLAATPVFAYYGKDGAYWCLFIGMFLFALGNGTCEAVINPLTATLYSRNKTHWLNILHAGWPGGLILGALLGLLFGSLGNTMFMGVRIARWEIQMSVFLVPTLAYGVMMLGRRFPRSEASKAGVSMGTMLLEFASPILLLLLVLHALVGYVELGTDSWITNITGRIMANAQYGLLLFIWTSGLMFVLRFFAGPIVHKISPLGLLLVSALLGCAGLFLLGTSDTILTCALAATVYGFGKTFLWPTMLGVASERFPKGGALTLGMIGGVGALSAGLLGTPGIGYKQDYFASKKLQESDMAAYKRYKADEQDSFLFFPAIYGLDGSKKETLLGKPGQDNGDGKLLAEDIANLQKAGRKLSEDKSLEKLDQWWTETGSKHATEDKTPVLAADLYGGKMALTYTAAIPAAMALGYLILIIYFRAKGGYTAQVLTGHKAEDEKFTGGVEGPADL